MNRKAAIPALRTCQSHGAGALTSTDNLLPCVPVAALSQGLAAPPGHLPFGKKMLCTSLWGFSGVVAWVSMARIGSGKVGASVSSSCCPHAGQSLFLAAPRQSHRWPKMCPSAAWSWLWGKGCEVGSEVLDSWKCEPRASLLCLHASVGWGCTGGCGGTDPQ